MSEAKTKTNEKQNRSGDMTRGNPWRRLIVFALPILLGSILQQLYNAIDAIIVGHAVGSTALGAVGSTGAVVQMLIALFMGLSSGTCVVAANYFGRKDKENLSKTVHTAILLAVFVGVLISVIGIILSPVILRIMKTPSEMMDDAVIYLQIFFAGVTGLAIYNVGASIMQAVGNSRFPLYFLLGTTALNIIGDLLLVVVLKMGVAGAAIATIVSEMASAFLVLLVLSKSRNDYRLSFKQLKVDKAIMKRMLSIGLPGALQQSIVSASNIMVQSYINGLGISAVAGYAAENKLDAFLPLPINAMALATSTFVSQNLGAGEEKRARKGVWIAAVIGISATATLSIIVMFFHDLIFRVFSTDPQVLDFGWQFARVIVPFYIVLAGSQILPGALRGAGKVKFATITCVTCFVIVRQIYLFVATSIVYNVFTVAMCYPVTWLICSSTILIYFLSKDHITADGFTRIHILRTDGTNADFLEICKKLDMFQNETVPGRSEAGLNSVYNSENLKDIFLLYDGQTAIGSAGLFCHDKETCEIVRMFVDSPYRGKGLEKRLINEVQVLAKSLGYKKVHLRTFGSIKEMVDAFEKIGFSPIDPNDFKYADKYPQALLLAPLRVYMMRDLTDLTNC